MAKDGRCGARAIFRINDENLFIFRLNFGNGTNTKVELLALWCLIKIFTLLGIDSLSIFGDSLMIIR